MDLLTLYQLAKSRGHDVTVETTVTTGFENVAWSEVNKNISDILDSCKDRGRVFFNTDSDNLSQVLKLRSIDNVSFIVYCGKHSEMLEDKEEALKLLEKMACGIDWQQAVSTWKKVSNFEGNCFPSEDEYRTALEKEKLVKRRLWENLAEKKLSDNMHLHNQFCEFCQKGLQNDCNFVKLRGELKEYTCRSETKKLYKENDMRNSGDRVLKYRVTCYRTGSHSFASQDAARCVGGRLQDKYYWVVDLVHYDLEIIINIRCDEVYMCVALTDESLHHRNIVHFGPTTLRATVCYNLLHLADPLPGDVVVDPLCGGSSIPIEGALAFPATYHLCGDIHMRAVTRSLANIQELRSQRMSYIGLMAWNAKALPLRDSSVDVLVTDLPFGKRSGSKFNNQFLYEGALREFARILRPAGRAVCLTWDKRNFLNNITKLRCFWTLLKTLKVNIGGLNAAAYVLRRKDRAVISNCKPSGEK